MSVRGAVRGGGAWERSEDRGYSAEDIDFLVAHVPPEEAWYVIPVEAFAPHLHLWLYPRGEHAGQYEKYREAWELLGAGSQVVGVGS